jgi:hypothetical protein
MKSIESRVAALEQSIGATGEAPNMVVCFVRAPDRFCTGYLRIKTGEEVIQGVTEPDADFVVRAKAAGFERRDHEY